MNTKRILSLLLVFILLLSNVPALALDDNEIDYKKFVERIQRGYMDENDGKTFDTPTPIFNVTVNGETYTVEPDDNVYQDSTKIEPHVIVPVGTEISLTDMSIGGDGRSINGWDWQVYKRDTDYKEYDRITSSSKNINTIKADKEGYILVFLNVKDNLNYEGYANWSDKGNWREGRITDFSYMGNKVVGWYFTYFKIQVANIPDFDISTEQSQMEFDKAKLNSVDLNFTVGLNNTDEELNTVVDFYKGTQLLESKDVSIIGNETIDVSFTVTKEQLAEGVNNFYAVVNSDYDLTVARPYEEEVYLDNNKAEVTITAIDTAKPIEPPKLPPVATWDAPRSPNVAIKWDKVPLQIKESSTVTGKIRRESVKFTWVEYDFTGQQIFQGTSKGTFRFQSSKTYPVTFAKDKFFQPRTSNKDWYTESPSPKYTVPSNGKPGTELIAKLTVKVRTNNSFPGLPPAPQKPQPEVSRPSYPRPHRPSRPPKDASDGEWDSYYSEMDHYDSLIGPWDEYDAYISSPEYQRYLLEMEDYGKLVSVRGKYNEKTDMGQSKVPIIPVEGYNFAEYAAYHHNFNSFVNSHYRRYVAIEDYAKQLFWFTIDYKEGQAESKNSIVHIPVDPGKGGLDPSIIVNPPKPPKK